MESVSMHNSIALGEVYNGQQARKEGLTDKFRQKIQGVGKGGQTPRQQQVAEQDLSYLTARSQVRTY